MMNMHHNYANRAEPKIAMAGCIVTERSTKLQLMKNNSRGRVTHRINTKRNGRWLAPCEIPWKSDAMIVSACEYAVERTGCSHY